MKKLFIQFEKPSTEKELWIYKRYKIKLKITDI